MTLGDYYAYKEEVGIIADMGLFLANSQINLPLEDKDIISYYQQTSKIQTHLLLLKAICSGVESESLLTLIKQNISNHICSLQSLEKKYIKGMKPN